MTWEEFQANSPVLRDEFERLADEQLPDLGDVGVQRVPGHTAREANELGEPRASIHFRGERNYWRYVTISIAVLVVIVGILAICNGGRASPVGIIIGLSLFASSCGGAMISRRAKPRTFWVCPGGIIWQHGNEVDCCPWDEVEEVYLHEAPEGLIVDLTLGLAHARFAASHSEAAVRVGEYIELKASQAALRRALHTVYRGGTAKFGTLDMNRKGLFGVDLACPWSRIERITVRDFTMRVYTGEKHFRISYQDIALPKAALALTSILRKETLPICPDPVPQEQENPFAF